MRRRLCKIRGKEKCTYITIDVKQHPHPAFFHDPGAARQHLWLSSTKPKVAHQFHVDRGCSFIAFFVLWCASSGWVTASSHHRSWGKEQNRVRPLHKIRPKSQFEEIATLHGCRLLKLNICMLMHACMQQDVDLVLTNILPLAASSSRL